jgi:hypothetical protein
MRSVDFKGVPPGWKLEAASKMLEAKKTEL